jgi:hypothetical protein
MVANRLWANTRRIMAAAVTLMVVVEGSAPAAATLCGCGMVRADFQIKPYTYNDSWQGPMDQAIWNWNSTPTPVWITKSSSAPSWVTAASYSDTWYGLYTTHWYFGRYFDIKLNARTISRDAYNFSNFVTSCFVHELGHALNLDDNPNTSSPSIMKQDRDRNSMTTPQQYDIDDVNYYY